MHEYQTRARRITMTLDIRSHGLPGCISESSSCLIIFRSAKRYDINSSSIPGIIIYLETMNLRTLNLTILL